MTAPQRGRRRDCEHVRAHHQHGTVGGYRADGCRCSDCTASHLADRRDRVRAQVTGRWAPFTPAGPVREHIERLRSAGVGIDRIAQLSGVPGSTVRLVIYGKQGLPIVKLNTATAARLLSAQPQETNRARRSTVDSAQTRARLRDLLAAGLTWDDLAGSLGRSAANLRRTFDCPTVTVKTADEIADLHDSLLAARSG